MTPREMLEAGIANNFHDTAAHAAYADLLQEMDDPRGEYIQLRLALENENQSHRLLQQWRERAARIYAEHEEDWLGPLSSFLLHRDRRVAEPTSPNIEFTFYRGWLTGLDVNDAREAFLTVLGHAREARMLQSLTLHNTRLPNAGQPLTKLVNGRFWDTLKSFTLGDRHSYTPTAEATGLVELIAQAWQLKVLHVYADALSPFDLVSRLPSTLASLAIGFLPSLPFGALARNASLQHLERLFLASNQAVLDDDNFELQIEVSLHELQQFLLAPQFQKLTDLTIRAQGLGDDGCEMIARSGFLRQLKSLDLRQCNITDEGATVLARSPDLLRLERLDIGANRLTLVGIEELRETGITIQWDSQFGEYPEMPLGDAFA